MRTLIEVRDSQIKALDKMARDQKKSRAALIREAIDALLARNPRPNAAAAFGIWGPEREDGLAYQERIRAEW